MKYIAYYRVSTKKQGLGLEAQKAAVEQFCKQENAEIINQYQEKESGKDNHRPQLELALRECQKEGAVLLIAKLDRLSRRVSFIFALREAQIQFRALDMPDVQDVLTLSIYAGLAEQERNLISKRTKEALQALKANGKILGARGKDNLTDEGRAKGIATIKRNAAENINNIKAAQHAKKMQEQGYSLHKIAASLNEYGLTTARGGKHTATSVMRLLQRF